MNLDIELIKQAMSAFSTALSVLKQAKDLLPESSQKQEISAAIESAERRLKYAELELAKALGHEICQNHWPSGIMLSSDRKIWRCLICGNEIDKNVKQTQHPGRDLKSI